VTSAQARGVWEPLTRRGEGWLDAAVRIELERGLTDAERTGIDVLWGDALESLQLAGIRAAEAARVLAQLIRPDDRGQRPGG
jgi:hypothetical protein